MAARKKAAKSVARMPKNAVCPHCKSRVGTCKYHLNRGPTLCLREHPCVGGVRSGVPVPGWERCPLNESGRFTNVVSEAELEWVADYNAMPCDEEELTERAAKVEGRLGDAARALLGARQRFDAELKRVGYERG